MIPYPTDAQAKADILAAGRKIYQRGLVAANDGNLSVRVGENALWVTPTGVCKGDMTEDMLVKMTLDGTVLEGTRKPSSETKMHLRIYQENPTVRAVVHAHPPVATTFAAPGTSRCSRRRWSNWAPCRWPPLPSPAPRGWQTAWPPSAGTTGPCCWNTTAPSPGAPAWSRPTTGWSAWNRWPPSPCTCTP